MWNIPHKKLIFGLLLGLVLFGAQFVLLSGRAFAQARIAADNSIQVANSPPNSFEVKKTVTFTLSEPTEVFVRYDLGQSHGCCADHRVGDLRILVDGIVFRRDLIPFINYGVQPISAFLEDFDYFFPSQVVLGLEPPVSRLDPTRVGPLLQNYKRVDRQGLGNLGLLAAGSHTFELELGDAGWNSIFEIYSRLPRRQVAPDATAFGPLQTTFREYKCDPARVQDAIVPLCATVNKDVLNSPPRQPLMTELWARVYMPVELNSPPYPLLVFLHGNHGTCGRDQGPGEPRRDTGDQYAVSGICPPSDPIIVPNHAGYGYLAERLASWGYIVVSINANRGVTGLANTAFDPIATRGRLVLKHFELLSKWNIVGGSGPFLDGVELKDTLDFTQVGLLGHSQGGEGVRAAYGFYTFGGDELNPTPWAAKIPNRITFKGIFEIGPSDGIDKSRVFNPFGVKWNVLLPMCDGDNFELSGIKPFDRMVAVEDPSQKSTFAVWGANHNFYNTEWQESERSRRVDCVGAGNLRLFPSTIGSPQQRQTALASVMAFFRGNVGRDAEPAFNRLFNPDFALPPVVTMVTRVDRGYTDGPARVFEDFGSPLTGLNTYGLPNDIMGITIEHILNGIPDHNRSDPGGQTRQTAARLSWTEPGGHFQINWNAGEDISRFQTLEFRVSRQCGPPHESEPLCSQSPEFDLNPHPLNPTEPTNFSVRLALSGGRLSEPVQLAAYTDLAGPVGVTPVGVGIRLHPILQTVRIPLADFRLPLNVVRGVRFTFDSTPTGAIYMSDIRLSGGTR